MSIQTQRHKATLYMVLCAILWSIGGIFIKLIPWNAFVIAGARSFLGCIVILAYIIFSKKKIIFNKVTVLVGIFLAGTLLCFVVANKLTTAANAIVLQFTAPVFILIFSSIFFKKKFKKGDIIAVGVTLMGISLFFLDQLSPGGLLGNIIAILAGVCFSLMFIFTDEANEDEKMSGIFWGQVFTAAVGLPFLFFFETPFTFSAVSSILILGILQLGIPYILYALAARHCSPLNCSLIGAIEPLLNPVWVFIFNGEAPGIFALIGGIIVVIAISVWCVWQEKCAKQYAKSA